MKTCWPLNVLIVVENVATVVAVLGYVWIHSLPYHISASQERSLVSMYAIVGLGLILAWISGSAALVSVWVSGRKLAGGSGQHIGCKRWALVSMLATLGVTCAHVMTVRIGSVGL
jgi:hypothetical protein